MGDGKLQQKRAAGCQSCQRLTSNTAHRVSLMLLDWLTAPTVPVSQYQLWGCTLRQRTAATRCQVGAGIQAACSAVYHFLLDLLFFGSSPAIPQPEK